MVLVLVVVVCLFVSLSTQVVGRRNEGDDSKSTKRGQLAQVGSGNWVTKQQVCITTRPPNHTSQENLTRWQRSRQCKVAGHDLARNATYNNVR